MLPPEWLDQLRDRTCLSALIGRSVKLTKAGNEFKACCPFHNEKTASFYVNDDKGFYHCFGCQAHGDAIRWLTDQKGLTFMDAVKELAGAAGMEVPAQSPQAAEREQRQAGMYGVLMAAALWYRENLEGLPGAAARAYLEERGVGPELRQTFGLGYAPASRTALKAALSQFDMPQLVEAGLIIAPEEEGREPYDRFRDRVMFPIRDGRARVIGFGGRGLGAVEPKYLNSPATALFDKGRSLFNVDRAAAAARRSGRIVVVEGYMDVIGLARVGIEDVVAPNGTAITEWQIEKLWRMAGRPVMCFDGDAAGIKAASRAARRALEIVKPGQSVSFVQLPPGQDPDDVARGGGAAAVEALLATPEPLVDRIWADEVDGGPLDTPEDRAGFRARLRERVESIRDGEVRRLYGQEFRARLGGAGRQAAQRRAVKPQPVAGSLSERSLIVLLMRHPELVAEHSETVASIPIAHPDLALLRDRMVHHALGGGQMGVDEWPELIEALLADTLAQHLARIDDAGRRERALVAIASTMTLSAELEAVTGRLADGGEEADFTRQRQLLTELALADAAMKRELDPPPD